MGLDLTAAQMAELFGVSDRHVRRLEKQGVFKKTGRGKYNATASLEAYLEAKSETDIGDDLESVSAGEEVKIERARRLRLQNDELENNLISTVNAINAVDAVVGVLRAELAGVPARVSTDLTVRKEVEDAIDQVLASISRRCGKVGQDLAAGSDPLDADEEAHAG